MSLVDLTKQVANGDPGSPNAEHALAVLQARGIEASTAAAEAGLTLVKETRSLRKATWVMAVGTFAAVVVAIVAVVVALAS